MPVLRAGRGWRSVGCVTLLLRSLATATPIGLLFPRGAALPVLDTTAIVPGEVIHCNGDLFGQPPLAGVMEAGASMPEGASGVMYQAINANGPDYLPAVYTDSTKDTYITVRMIGPQNQGFYIRPDRIRQVAAWVAASCVQNKGEGGVATVGFTRAVHTTQRVLYDHRQQFFRFLTVTVSTKAKKDVDYGNRYPDLLRQFAADVRAGVDLSTGRGSILSLLLRMLEKAAKSVADNPGTKNWYIPSSQASAAVPTGKTDDDAPLCDRATGGQPTETRCQAVLAQVPLNNAILSGSHFATIGQPADGCQLMVADVDPTGEPVSVPWLAIKQAADDILGACVTNFNVASGGMITLASIGLSRVRVRIQGP